jgi:toxin FitB
VIVLDTNVVSELMRPQPAPPVLEWVDAQPSSDLLLTSVTAAELRAGVALLPRGRRQATIADRVETLIDETFAGYVLPFDVDSSTHYAEIVATRTRAGSPISTADAQFAAICRQHDATLATRNTPDFLNTGLTLVNPWEANERR